MQEVKLIAMGNFDKFEIFVHISSTTVGGYFPRKVLGTFEYLQNVC